LIGRDGSSRVGNVFFTKSLSREDGFAYLATGNFGRMPLLHGRVLSGIFNLVFRVGRQNGYQSVAAASRQSGDGAMISQQVLMAVLMTIAAMTIPFWGWTRMLQEVQQREGSMRERRRAAMLRQQQEREEVIAALLPVAAPETAEKGKKK
jgi:hypothetical protein